MNKISRLWALVITISILALGAVVANSNSPSSAEGGCAGNVHRWSAHLMVLVLALHMIRVFYAGAYKKPREFNWVIGVVLLLITLGLSFTGYLLPWDQLSYWAVTVGTNLVHYVPVLGGTLQNLLIGGDPNPADPRAGGAVECLAWTSR